MSVEAEVAVVVVGVDGIEDVLVANLVWYLALVSP